MDKYVVIDTGFEFEVRDLSAAAPMCSCKSSADATVICRALNHADLYRAMRRLARERNNLESFVVFEQLDRFGLEKTDDEFDADVRHALIRYQVNV